MLEEPSNNWIRIQCYPVSACRFTSLSRSVFQIIRRPVRIHPAKNKQIDYSFSFLLSKCISNEIHCLEDCPGVFQLPVSWNELLVVFHGHDLIKFNPSIWFLLALFNCNILFYLIHFLREKHLPVMFAVTILIGCAGFYLGKLQIELPLYIDVSMTAPPSMWPVSGSDGIISFYIPAIVSTN